MALKKDPKKCLVEKPMFIAVLFASRVKGGQSTSMTAKLAGKVPAAWIPTWVGRLATFAQNERQRGPSGTISNVQYPRLGLFDLLKRLTSPADLKKFRRGNGARQSQLSTRKSATIRETLGSISATRCPARWRCCPSPLILQNMPFTPPSMTTACIYC
jgi:hypothetical protein